MEPGAWTGDIKEPVGRAGGRPRVAVRPPSLVPPSPPCRMLPGRHSGSGTPRGPRLRGRAGQTPLLLVSTFIVVPEPVFLELGSEGLPRDPQALGGARLVPFAYPQGVLDRHPLQILEATHDSGRERFEAW